MNTSYKAIKPVHQSRTKIEAKGRLSAIIQANVLGKGVLKVVADAWKAVVSSSNGVVALEDIVCGVIIR
jgi:hypothetical protein